MSSENSSAELEAHEVEVHKKKKKGIWFVFKRLIRKRKSNSKFAENCKDNNLLSKSIHSGPNNGGRYLVENTADRGDLPMGFSPNWYDAVEHVPGNDGTYSEQQINDVTYNDRKRTLPGGGRRSVSDTSLEEKENLKNEAKCQDMMMLGSDVSCLNSNDSEAVTLRTDVSDNTILPVQEGQSNNISLTKNFAILVVTLLAFRFALVIAITCLALLTIYKILEKLYTYKKPQTPGLKESWFFSKLILVPVLPLILIMKCLFAVSLKDQRKYEKARETSLKELLDVFTMVLFPPLILFRILDSVKRPVKPPSQKQPTFVGPGFRHGIRSSHPGRGCSICRKLGRW